jgi:O-antigen/teichoic acid export membrane protein
MRIAGINIVKVARRASWGLADQGLSSLTNFAVGVVIARSVSPHEFGAFGLAFATYLVLLGASRAITSEPLLVRFSSVSQEVWRIGTRSSTGATMAVGILTGLVSISVGIVLRGTLGSALVSLGITLPGLLLQDGWRQAFFANGRGSQAFLNDLIWSVALVPMLIVASTQPSNQVFWFMFAWGASATCAAIVGLFQAKLFPRISDSRSWLIAQRDLVPRFLSEFIVRAGGAQLVFFGLGAVAGLSSVGSIRAAQIILGPFHVVFQGIWLVAIPEQVRILKRSPMRLRRASLIFSGFLAATAVIYGVALLFVPDALGRALVGANWVGAQSILFPLALSFAGLGGVMGAASGLRALAAAGRSLRARIASSVLLISGGMIGAVLADAVGAAIGLAAANWLGALIWWSHFNAAFGEYLIDNRDGEPFVPAVAPPTRDPEQIS